MKQIRLLLLSCGTNACYHLSKTLKEKFGTDFYIIGTDINKRWLVSSTLYLDDFIQCPCNNDDEYYDFIIKLCKKYKPSYLLPSFDADQMLFYPENDDLIEIGVKSLGTSQKTLEIYRNKILMSNFLANNCFPVPKIFFKNFEKETSYFLKPINGVGSVGISKITGAELLKYTPKKMLIQELCDEPEITLECFNYDGYFSSIARNRIISKSGVCVKAFVFNDTELENVGKRLSQILNTPIYFNLQFMRNKEKQFVITDVNFRMPGGMSIGFSAGWDAASALAYILKNDNENIPYDTFEKLIPKKIRKQYIVRAYTDIVTKKIKKNIAFDFDGTLLDSRKRHIVVMNDVLGEFQLNLSTDDLIEYKSDGKNNISWLESKGINTETAIEIQKRWMEKIEQESYLKLDKLYFGVFELLEKLSLENSLYLVTARRNLEAVKTQIVSLGIEQYFDEVKIVSQEKSSVQKASYMKHKCIDVFIGDTELDYTAADIIGCNFIPVNYGFRSEKFWKEKGINSLNNVECIYEEIKDE